LRAVNIYDADELIIICDVEVDEAVAAAQHDGTGGRGANGHITNALQEEQKKDGALRNAV
jgi:hypothetical protein